MGGRDGIGCEETGRGEGKDGEGEGEESMIRCEWDSKYRHP